MKLTKSEADLIRAGFSVLFRDRVAAAETFYAHLFRIAPETRALFVTEMERQGTKLMNTLSVVIDQVDNWGLLTAELEELAMRHTAYGVRREHYELTGVALTATLRDCLGPEFTPEMADVWSRIYGEIEAVMVNYAYRHPANGEF